MSRTGQRGQSYIGRSIEAIAAAEQRPPEVVELELCERFGNKVEVVLHYRTERDMLAFLRHPLAVVGSGGSAIPLEQHGDKAHRRHFGTFPRILGRYVRDRSELALEDAIAKMTARPAERTGIRYRGRIMVGLAADLVVFDPSTVLDNATFEDPTQAPTGIRDVVINGVTALRDGEQLAARPGRVLLASGS